jgi:hypothetical protein
VELCLHRPFSSGYLAIERSTRLIIRAIVFIKAIAISGSAVTHFMNALRLSINIVMGVSLVTVAVRGPPSNSDISPK